MFDSRRDQQLNEWISESGENIPRKIGMAAATAHSYLDRLPSIPHLSWDEHTTEAHVSRPRPRLDLLYYLLCMYLVLTFNIGI